MVTERMKQVVEEVKKKKLDSETIIKVIELLEFAETRGVELYILKGKLRMKYTEKKVHKDDFGDIFGNEDMFNSFKDIFGGKKK